MGFMDKIKGLFRGNKQQVKGGIDTASDQVEKRVSTDNAAKVEQVSEKAKDAVDKLAADEPAAPAAEPPVAPASSTPPVAPTADPPAAPSS